MAFIYYYEMFQVSVAMSGPYMFSSNSSIDAYGYLYRYGFSPENPKLNLIFKDDNSGDGLQFKLTPFLQINTTYVLVVTTYEPLVTGAFSINASSPTSILMHHLGKEKP